MNDNRNSLDVDYIPDIQEILLILWRRRFLIASIIFTSLVLGIAYLAVRPAVYKATGTIMLEDGALNLENFQDVTAGVEMDSTAVQTQVKVIGSPSVALKVIEANDLENVPEFAAENPQDDASNHKILEKYLRQLEVKPQNNTRVIEVSFISKDPVLAADIANAHINAYMESQIQAKKQRILSFTGWFEDQVNQLKTALAEKSRKVQQYRAQEDLVMGEDSDNPIYQQISEIFAQLTSIEVKKSDLNARLEIIKTADDNKNLAAISEVVDSSLIQNLKGQASTIGQKVESYRAELGAKHPKLIAAKKELTQVNGAISSEIKNIETSLRNEAEALSVQESLLREKLAALGTQADALRGKTITLHELELEETANQKLLDSFLDHYEEIQSQTDFARSGAVILSPAVQPLRPDGASKALLLAGIFVISSGIALAIVFLLEIFSTGIKNFEDIKRHMAQNPLGILPEAQNPLLALSGQGSAGYRENLKRIYMSGLMNKPVKTVLFTSALSGEGRSTLLMSLAYYLLSLNHKIVVVDMDFFKPSLSRMAKVKDSPGFTDLMSGKASLKNVIAVNEDGLTVIPAGTPALYSPDFAHSRTFKDILQQLRDNYDYVFIDGGPALAHSGTVAIAESIDGIILVAHWLKTSRKDLSSLMDTQKNTKAKILGVVLNRVNIKKYKSLTTGSDFVLPKFGT